MTERHESSCAVYNAPAYEPGPCDCKYREQNEHEAFGDSVVQDFLKSQIDFAEAIEKGVEAIRMSDQ